MESSEMAGEHSLTKLEIQLGLISEAFGESFGRQLFSDGTLDYLYVRGVILVRDAYLAEVARLLEEDGEPEERGQEFVPVEGLLPRVSLFSVGNRDEGMAKWSGTSFSARVVAGLVTATGENGRQAASALLAQARAQYLAGVGPVLWPCDTGEGGDRACCCGGNTMRGGTAADGRACW